MLERVSIILRRHKTSDCTEWISSWKKIVGNGTLKGLQVFGGVIDDDGNFGELTSFEQYPSAILIQRIGRNRKVTIRTCSQLDVQITFSLTRIVLFLILR
ncbi:hypothetical protein D3C80_1207690 [compost metagenome]